jgi:hypothetical protein
LGDEADKEKPGRRAKELVRTMSSKKSKLHLMCAFAALVTLALAASCRGFFVNPTLTAITVSPNAPQVELNTTLSPALQAYGTYSDGSTGVVSSGVSWSSETPSVATVTSGGVLAGVSLGTATIDVSAQAVSGSATATVFLGGITAMTVSPANGGTITGTNSQTFTYTATANGSPVEITTDNGGTLTITPTDTDLTCSPSGNTEVCTADGNQTTSQTVDLVMSYPGTNITATATLTTAPSP